MGEDLDRLNPPPSGEGNREAVEGGNPSNQTQLRPLAFPKRGLKQILP